jgi:hypothetical protein
MGKAKETRHKEGRFGQDQKQKGRFGQDQKQKLTTPF